MLPCLRKLFETEKKEYVPDVRRDNNALVAALQTEFYKERFVDSLIEVIQKDGLTAEESELLTRVELHITENLAPRRDNDGSERMVGGQGVRRL